MSAFTPEEYLKVVRIVNRVVNEIANPEEIQEAIDLLRRERTNVIARNIRENLLNTSLGETDGTN